MDIEISPKSNGFRNRLMMSKQKYPYKGSYAPVKSYSKLYKVAGIVRKTSKANINAQIKNNTIEDFQMPYRCNKNNKLTWFDVGYWKNKIANNYQ